jgi:hypothetical protein
LTKSSESFIIDPASFFENQAVPNIKSSQLPEMYPSRPWCSSAATRDGLEEWSKRTFRYGLLEERKPESGNGFGEIRRLVPRHMYSLYEIGIKLAAIEWNHEHHGESAIDDEVVRTIVYKPPRKWKATLEKRGVPSMSVDTALTRFDPTPYMYPPYTEQERAILSPLFVR